MEFEGGETFCVDASVNEDDMCCESDDAFIEVHDLDETLVDRSCVDAVVAVSYNPDLVDPISPDPLDIFHASLSCSPPSPSLECCDLYRLILMRCFRGMMLKVLLEGMTPPLILIVCT